MPSRHETNALVIDKMLARDDLTAEDVLMLTAARRLNGLSDKLFAEAMGGTEDLPPLNFWGRR